VPPLHRRTAGPPTTWSFECRVPRVTTSFCPPAHNFSFTQQGPCISHPANVLNKSTPPLLVRGAVIFSHRFHQNTDRSPPPPQPCRECLGVVAFVYRRNRRVDEALTRLDCTERLEGEVAALSAARASLLDRALAAEVGWGDRSMDG